MNAIVNTAPGKCQWQTVPDPQPGSGQVRIRTHTCAICATDLEMIAGWPRTAPPAIPGHEWCGVVDAVGDRADAAWVGRRVVGDNVLSDGGEVGFEHPGGYAEMFVTEAANLYELPDNTPGDVGALVEPAAVCLRAMRRWPIEPPCETIVIGDGPIGLMLVLLALDAGVERPVLIGGRRARLDLARDFGAETFDYHASDDELVGTILKAHPAGFAHVAEASGSPRGMASGLALAAQNAKVVVVGDYGEARASFAWNDLLHRELTIAGSNTGSGAWADAVRWAAERRAQLERLVTHRFKASQFEQALALARRRGAGAIKIVLQWEESTP